MPRFMIHEHDAIKAGLHHDLRIEMDGVYKSWAIPKTIDPNTDAKRLAIEVADHSLAYGEWEGTIADGYGAGEVKIWDSGTCQLATMGDGKWQIKFFGGKLSGTWLLIKTKRDKQWIFFNKK
jgi:bifunctional non-homologous end joining protein LigD